MRNKIKLLLSLLIMLSGGMTFGQFPNGDFESVTCPDLCDVANSNMSCVDDWMTITVPEQRHLYKASCPGDIVCSGNYSVELVASTGGGHIIWTENPFFGWEFNGMPQIITMTENTGIGDLGELGVKITGANTLFDGVDSEALGFNIPSTTGICETVPILVKPEIVDFEFLALSVTNVNGGSHGGSPWTAIIDDIQHCGDLFNFSEECGNLTISINECYSNIGILGHGIAILDADGGLIAERNSDEAGFEDFVIAIPENGIYTIDLAIIFDNPGGILGDFDSETIFFTFAQDVTIETVGEFCCDLFTDADFTLIGDGTTLTVTGFEVYEDFDATHEWQVLVSPNPSGGPYTPLATVTSTTETTVEVYDATIDGFYYTVIHTITSPCGEICFTRVQYQDGDGFGGEITTSFVPESPCGEIECLGTAPTDLNLDYGTGLLTWTGSSPTDTYIVTVYYDNLNCCGRSKGTSSEFIVTGTSFIITSYGSECTGFKVGAYCNETTINWSDIYCVLTSGIGPGFRTANQTNIQEGNASQLEASISPNPSSGKLQIVVSNATDSPVSLSIYNISGELIQHTENFQLIDGQLIIDMDTESFLQKGVYFFVIKTTEEIITQRVVLE